AALGLAAAGAFAQSHGHSGGHGGGGAGHDAGGHGAMHGSAPGHGHGTMPTHGGAAETTRTKPSANGHYVVSIAPEAEPVAINAMHRWVLTLTTPDGRPVENAEIAVDGGMPEHGHGLPTAPRVTERLGDGRYLIEGMRFNMA